MVLAEMTRLMQLTQLSETVWRSRGVYLILPGFSVTSQALSRYSCALSHSTAGIGYHAQPPSRSVVWA